MLGFIRLQPMAQRAGAKKKGQKTKLREGKNKGGWDKLPLMSDFMKKELKIFMNVKLFTWGLPHELMFYIN